MASMNPFSKPSTVATETKTMNESIASSTSKAGTQVKAAAVSTKNAIGKTATAMTSVFRRKSDTVASGIDPTDPLSLENRPDKVDAEVFIANGQMWESTGDLTKAMERYNKALESTPNHPKALASIARLHFTQGNYPEAAKTFQTAVTQSPNDAALYNDLGLTLSKMGNHAGAMATIERALQLAPGTSRYANNLATVKFEAGDTNSAMQVLAQNNKPAVAHFNMAYLHFKSGQMPQARTQITETLKYAAQAGDDVAVGRAIERSREMLAQIDASNGANGTVAQIAAQPQSTGPQQAGMAATAPITPARQASSTTNLSGGNDGVANYGGVNPGAGYGSPSPTLGPAMAAITPTKPSMPRSTTADLGGSAAQTGAESSSGSQPSWTQAWNPNWQQPPVAPSPEPAVKPTRPTETKPADKPAVIRPTMGDSSEPDQSSATAKPASPTASAPGGGFTMPN